MKSIGLVFVTCFFSLLSFSQECPDSCAIFIPNVLTPDCESFDCELLEITSNCKFSKMNFVIYNKWGDLIFETDDQKQKFDSRENPQGTYIWILKGGFCNGKKIDYEGSLTILK